MMKKLLLASALLLTPFVAHADALGKASKNLHCYQQPHENWEPGITFGVPSYRDNTTRRFKGKVDHTFVMTNQDDRLQRVIFAVDSHPPGEAVNYRHSQRIWKYLNRKFGAPLTTDWAWFWAMESGAGIFMWTTGGGVAVMLECPHYE